LTRQHSLIHSLLIFFLSSPFSLFCFFSLFFPCWPRVFFLHQFLSFSLAVHLLSFFAVLLRASLFFQITETTERRARRSSFGVGSTAAMAEIDVAAAMWN
jgi:hypothetical protein